MQAIVQTSAELSHDEIQRYARHVIMPEVGIDGQRKLKAAKRLFLGNSVIKKLEKN